jgi:hypothetical protein
MKTVLGDSEGHILYVSECGCPDQKHNYDIPGLVFGNGKFQASIRWPKEGKPGPRQIVIKELAYAQGVGPIKKDNEAGRIVLVLDFHNVASAKVFRSWLDLVISGHPGSFPDSQTSPGNYETQVDTALTGELNDDVPSPGGMPDSSETSSGRSGEETGEIEKEDGEPASAR